MGVLNILTETVLFSSFDNILSSKDFILADLSFGSKYFLIGGTMMIDGDLAASTNYNGFVYSYYSSYNVDQNDFNASYYDRDITLIRTYASEA